MLPSGYYGDDLTSTLIRYGLYITAIFQLVCMWACATFPDIFQEPEKPEKTNTDSDECSSEQSSPGHRANMARARRHDKKKRR